MKFVSIDTETTGLEPSWCQVLEIAAIVADLEETPVEKLPVFHCYVVHERIVGEPFALAMNAEILRTIATRNQTGAIGNFLYPWEVGPQFSGFLEKNGIDFRNCPAAGKNFASFDRQFLERLEDFRDFIKFKHRALDPALAFWDPVNDEWLPNTQLCLKRANMPPMLRHRAIDDAAEVVGLVRRSAKMLASLRSVANSQAA